MRRMFERLAVDVPEYLVGERSTDCGLAELQGIVPIVLAWLCHRRETDEYRKDEKSDHEFPFSGRGTLLKAPRIY